MTKKNLTPIGSIAVFILIGISFMNAQEPVVRASLVENGYHAIVETQLEGPLPDGLKNILNDRSNYRLYKISFDDRQQPVREEIALDTVLEDDASIVCSGTAKECPAIFLQIRDNKIFIPDLNYVIEIRGLTTFAANKTNFVPLHIGRPEKASTTATRAEILASLDPSRDELRVVANKEVIVPPTVDLISRGFRISDNGRRLVPDNRTIHAKVRSGADPDTFATTPQTGKEFTLELDKKLTRSRSHRLSIPGLSDQAADPVKTEGKIEFPAAPSVSENKFEFEFKFLSGKKQKPFFDFKGKYNAQSDIRLGKTCSIAINRLPCYWQPQATWDIGFGDTESKKAIVVDLPFRTVIYDSPIDNTNTDTKLAIGDGDRRIPRYHNWKSSSFEAGQIYLFLGPKFEFDQTFERFNGLASVKVDLKLARLLGSIKDQQGYLYDPGFTTKEEAGQTRLRFGYSLVPYIGLDGGRRFIGEEIENNGAAVSIPTFSILRSFAGVDGSVEFFVWRWPVKFSVGERLWYLGLPETIGFKTDTGVDSRRIRGFQHKGTASIDVYFTPVRNYSLNITYENGRDAPNFAYLNKVSAGFKVVY